jgi:hypothetical protein
MMNELKIIVYIDQLIIVWESGICASISFGVCCYDWMKMVRMRHKLFNLEKRLYCDSCFAGNEIATALSTEFDLDYILVGLFTIGGWVMTKCWA